MRQPDWRTIAPFVFGLIAFAALAALNQARGFDLWRNYALSGLGMGSVVCWALYWWDVRVPRYIQWVIVTGMLLHYGGGSLGSPDPFAMGLFGYHGINGAYHVHSWWDNLTHFVGVGAGTMATAYLLEAYQIRRGLAWRKMAVWGIAFTTGLAMGVGVELYEYLGKAVFQTIDQGGYSNTMLDLHFNILGAAAGGALAVTVDRRRLAQQIERHWGRRQATLGHLAWPERLPRAMAGFCAFVAPAALATLILGARYLIQGPPSNEGGAYDAALLWLLASAMTGVVIGPIAGWLWRRQTPGEVAN